MKNEREQKDLLRGVSWLGKANAGTTEHAGS